MVNPIKFKHGITSRPLKKLLEKPGHEWNDWYALSVLAVGLETVAVNLAPAAALIQSGARGNRYFTGLSIGYSSLGYPMPLFNYVTPGSAAEKFGAKLGGKVGAKKIGARVAGRLIPGLGWGLLAYDVYDVAVNRSLWGFDF